MDEHQDDQFAGNPYADASQVPPEFLLVNAVLLLAFEVRTANLLVAAKPIQPASMAEAENITNILKVIAPRLGMQDAGFVV
jgi:hypothetical protein